MSVTRRNVTIGGMSLLASASMSTMSRAELDELLGIGEGLRGIRACHRRLHLRLSPGDDGDDAQGHHQRRGAGRDAGADGPDHQAARISRRVIPGRDRAERRHALHHCIHRRRQGAVGAQHPRHEGPLLAVSDAGRLDHGIPGAGQADHRHRPRRPMRSPAQAGKARCRPASRSTNLRPASCGCSAASIAPARRKTMPRCTSCRTNSSWCR